MHILVLLCAALNATGRFTGDRAHLLEQSVTAAGESRMRLRVGSVQLRR
jgi:hypothetical protein